MEKKKKIIISAIIVIVVILLIGDYLFWGLIFGGPSLKFNSNVPSGFLYHPTSQDELSHLYQINEGKIPDEYLITDLPLDTDLIYQEGDTFVCKSSSVEAEKIEYFSYSPGRGVIGGWYYRYAVVCGDYYWIVDGNDAWGQYIYGPFEK